MFERGSCKLLRQGRRQEGEAVRCLEAAISAKPFPSVSLFFLGFFFFFFLLYKSDLAPVIDSFGTERQ